MSTLVKIKKRLIPTIGLMHEILLRCLFDNATKDERDVLDEAIKDWRKKINVTPMELWEIKRIENALIADERGHWNRARELLKKHNLHYRQLYKNGIPFIANPYQCRTFGKG